jgi:clan AA aspartic protease
MGYVHAKIELSNPRQPDLKPIPVEALADTGALMLCIPEHLALQLNLQQESEREVTVADGRSMKVPYVGPLKVSFQDRICFVGALVLGDSVLLGAVPLEDMDLTINPSRQCLEPDPRSPNIPHALVKAMRSHGGHQPTGTGVSPSLKPQPKTPPPTKAQSRSGTIQQSQTLA